jgi:hypothetical protein
VTLVDRRLASDIGQSILFLCFLVKDIFTLFFADVALVVAAVLRSPVCPLGSSSRFCEGALLELLPQIPSDSP